MQRRFRAQRENKNLTNFHVVILAVFNFITLLKIYIFKTYQ